MGYHSRIFCDGTNQPIRIDEIGLVKLSSIGRDGGLIVARVMPLRLHGSIARLLLPAGRCVCGFGDLAMPSVDPPRSPR